MLRNYGAQSGELYKPDSMNIGGGFDMGGFDMGGFSLGGGGADLNYTDDDPDSYSTIWEGEITDTTDADHERVITALRHISEGSGLETYMDVDNLLRYMAVHVFSVNEDSLSGMMAHNYYLYEYNGRLNIIPWDYNLALGGMSGSSATSVVNEAIDNAFAGTDFFDTLMENETYHAQYYEYLRRLMDEYINGGGFDALIDASHIDHEVMGSMDIGGGGGFGFGGQGGASGTASSGSGGGETGGGAPSFGSFPGAGSGTQSNSASALAQYAIALAIFAPRPNLRPPLPQKTKTQINKAPPPGELLHCTAITHPAFSLSPRRTTLRLR